MEINMLQITLTTEKQSQKYCFLNISQYKCQIVYFLILCTKNVHRLGLINYTHDYNAVLICYLYLPYNSDFQMKLII